MTCHAGNTTIATTQVSQSSSQGADPAAGDPAAGDSAAGDSSAGDSSAAGAVPAAGGRSGREAVTLTAHRLNQGEPDLRPEPPDANVDDVGAGIELDAPDRRQQLALGHRIPAVLHQGAQAEELEPGQGNRPGSAVGFQAAGVQGQLADLHDLAALGVL